MTANSTPISVSATPAGGAATNVWIPSFVLRVRVLDALTGRPAPGMTVERFSVDDEVYTTIAVTDHDGVLSLPLPVRAVLANAFDLTLSLHGVTLVAEASRREQFLGRRDTGGPILHRPMLDSTEGPKLTGDANFHLSAPSAASPQRAGTEGDPGWGWRLCGERAIGDAALRWPEFRSHLVWRGLPGAGATPGCAPGDWAAIQRETMALSMFFPQSEPCHLTVFALTATPPVWHQPAATSCATEGSVVPIANRPIGQPFMTSRVRGVGSGVEEDGRDFGAFIASLPGPPPPQPPGSPQLSAEQIATRGTKKHGLKRHRLDAELYYWRPHQGIDIAGRRGETAVYSVCAGEVVLVDATGGYGHEVVVRAEVRAENGSRLIRYAHLHERTHLTKGDHLRAGARIGTMGRSSVLGSSPTPYGKSSPTHLHFEVRSKAPMGTPMDPAALFEGDPMGGHVATWVLPSNSMPRLFPCDNEEGIDDPGHGCPRRGGIKASIVTNCWAAKNDLCPYKTTP